jgi:hypothetical protein
MARPLYSVELCRDDPKALQECLDKISNEGGRLISVTWQPARATAHGPDRATLSSGYTVVSEFH